VVDYRFRALDPGAPGPESDRYPVPAEKSLFRKANERGLPIGNLTSQFWGNVYLDELGHFVKRRLACPDYVRYGSGGNGAARAMAEQPVASATRNVGTLIGITAEQAMERGILFAGSPDTVYEQIMSFYREVGGFDHLIMVGRSGFLTHAEAEKGIRLFSKEVLPRLKEIAPVPAGS